MVRDHVLQFFAFAHLPEKLQEVSKPFGELAERVALLPESPERTKALDKLLEAKDAAVRALLAKPAEAPQKRTQPVGTFNCGRRTEDGRGPGSPFAPKDVEFCDFWRSDDSCSYCGSMKPETLMKRIETGDVELGPTDKSYKVYVENRGGPSFKQTYRKCPDGAKCAGPDECSHWVTQETDHSKFYFQHFTKEQCIAFVELLNAKKLKIGYPGHFYARPFFIAPPQKAS